MPILQCKRLIVTQFQHFYLHVTLHWLAQCATHFYITVTFLSNITLVIYVCLTQTVRRVPILTDLWGGAGAGAGGRGSCCCSGTGSGRCRCGSGSRWRPCRLHHHRGYIGGQEERRYSPHKVEFYHGRTRGETLESTQN